MGRFHLYYSLYLRNPLFFSIMALKQWMSVGSVIPSSSSLRRKLLHLGFRNRIHLDAVVLHGCGTGELLYELFRFLHTSGKTLKTCIIMEQNPAFVQKSEELIPHLRQIYPVPTEVVFETMDCAQTPRYLKHRGIERVDLIIGTLPYTNMPERITQWVRMYRDVTNTFCYYTYLGLFKRPSARQATRHMEQAISRSFTLVRKSNTIFINLPPAYVIIASSD